MEKRIKQLEKKNREQEHEISRLIDICNKLKVENEQLKSFINNLTSNDGKIWLSSGYVYDVKKVLKR